jgi:hypothetical protein
MGVISKALGISEMPGNVVANGPYWINRIAEEIATVINTLTKDSGWSDAVLASRFDVGFEGARLRKKGNDVHIQIMAINKPGQSGWAGETPILVLPAGYRPKYTFWLIGNAAGQLIELRVSPDGVIRSASASTSTVLVFSGTFPVD